MPAQISKNRVYRKRLLFLADFLEQLPKKNFNYGEWYKKDHCGTTGCALGWAATLPRFKKLGLHLHKDKYYGRMPVCKGEYREYAAMGIFGLTAGEAEYLFVPMNSRNSSAVDTTYGLGLPSKATPKQMAKFLRKFTKARFPKKPR